MSEEEQDSIDVIVVGFEEDDCLVSPTQPLSDEDMAKLVGRPVSFEDFKGKLWHGRVAERREDYLFVKFDQLPDGLGQGSLVRIPLKE